MGKNVRDRDEHAWDYLLGKEANKKNDLVDFLIFRSVIRNPNLDHQSIKLVVRTVSGHSRSTHPNKKIIYKKKLCERGQANAKPFAGTGR